MPAPLAVAAMARATRVARSAAGRLLPPLAGLLVFAGAWWLVGTLMRDGGYGTTIFVDTPVYREIGAGIVGGGMPYRDVEVEYPPLALPAFVAPYLLGAGPAEGEGYTAAFELVMLLCGLATVLLAWLALRALPARPLHGALALGLVALSPLLLGPVILSRYDLWPALLTTAAVGAAVSGHHRMGAAGLGLATMAKVYPAVIVPVLVIHVWRMRGRREALRCATVAVAIMLIVLVPFLVIAPDGILAAIGRQVGRPLQVESLGGAVILAVHAVAGLGVTIETGSGSQNVAGPLAGGLAIALTLVQLAAIAGTWLWFLRDPAGRGRLVRAAAAAVAAYVAFGKVLSPQYLIWLVPLVPLVGGRRGVLASGALLAALLLTQAYFPGQYLDLVERLDRSAIATLLLRDLALVAAVVALLWPHEERWPTLAAARTRLVAAVEALDPVHVLVVVLVGAALLRLVWLTLPAGTLIFDEAYYVNAARAILGWPIADGAPYAGAVAGLDPNVEHPPLGKVLIAGTMLVFGDNGLGWRLPSVVAGLLALAALYRIVRATGGGVRLATLAVVVFSLDNLSFVHGRIGVLDMPALAAILVGAWLGLTRRPVLAGTAFAVGCLIKVTAVFGLLAYLLVVAIPLLERWRAGEGIGLRDVRAPALAIVAWAVVALGGLWLLDREFTEFATPLDHVRHMVGYAAALSGGPIPGGIASQPWDWIVNGGGFDYLRVGRDTLVDGEIVASRVTVQFQALLNPVLIGSAALVVPFGLLLAVRRRDPLARWGLAWIAATYLPYYLLLAVSHRIMYFYYVLPVVPALSALTAVFLVRSRLPRPVVWGYLAALVVAYLALFPFRKVP